jgi:hypothetical protein
MCFVSSSGGPAIVVTLPPSLITSKASSVVSPLKCQKQYLNFYVSSYHYILVLIVFYYYQNPREFYCNVLHHLKIRINICDSEFLERFVLQFQV